MKIKKILTMRVSMILNFALLVILCSSNAFAAGEVDTTFNAYLAKVGNGTVYRSAVQPDGKVISAGSFNMVNGALRYTIVRLNTDGTLDTTFNTPIIFGYETISIHAIGLQSDGKIVIAGPFYQINGVQRGGVARLNGDGSPDTAFNSNPSIANIAQGYDLKITPDDKIVFSALKAGGAKTITRLNADGSLDAETTRDAFKLDVQADGKIVYFGNSDAVQRLNQDLTLDNTFSRVTPNNTVYLLKALSDGKILIGGIFSQVNGTTSPRLIKINANGSVDASFAANMFGVGLVPTAIDLPDGRIILPGGNGTLISRNSDGTADPSFLASTNMTIINDLDLQSDGKIVVSGSGESATDDTIYRPLVVRINADDSPDTTFQTAIGRFAYGNNVKTLPDNRFYVSGYFNYTGGAARRLLARFNADGTVDTTFNQYVFSSSFPTFDVFPDGKIIANGGSRLNPDGTLDITYNSGASGRDVVAQPDGKTLFAKNGSIVRYNSDGTLDTSFNVPVGGDTFDIALQPDGKILIGGNFLNVHGIDRSKIARLNADGTLDTSFNSPAGNINGVVQNIVLSPGGKLVIQGTFSGISFNTREGVARLNSNGSLDMSFVPPRSYSIDDIKVQPDGKVLLSGPGNPVIRRLNDNGSTDTTFNVTASVDNNDTPRVRGFDLQSDGKIVITGDFLRINGVLAPGIARLLNSTAPPKTMFDYDGDGRADVSVFRPSTNRWYVFKSSDSTVSETTFGIANDLVAPADYDGDGKTDIGIYRPSSGDWWYLSSVDSGQKSVHWGAAGDIPRPGDFDSDGKADFIVFRPSNNTWYRFGSTGATSIIVFGLSGDKPVTGDFDGDGKADVAIYRPSTGDWWWQSSIDNVQRATHWGISTDLPAPADYDGDGKTDFAVYRPSNGTWYIYNSATLTSTIFNFGIAEDKPVAADYDGDGKADIAVFRPSTGTWYQQKTTAGFAAQQFGVSTDIPTENAFVP